MLDWGKYMAIAEKFGYRARRQDRDDLRQDIILSLAEAQREQPGERPGLSTRSLFWIARYRCQKYWRQTRRAEGRVVSLSLPISDEGGHAIELGETIKDESAVDPDTRLAARLELAGYPRRLLAIGNKILRGTALLNEEHQYLWRFRRKQGKNGTPRKNPPG